MSKLQKISLPCLRGRMGDWFYYVTILKFKDVAERVKLPEEINAKYTDNNLKLSEWIQRTIEPKRIENIVDYLKQQNQRFFNSLILGLYDGNPSWQDVQLEENEINNNEQEIDYFSSTFGILTLEGTESIFAIDGQHRAFSIREALGKKPSLKNDEIPAIFVAHKATLEGNIRTRRLFSTLNKYAKPVSQSEIIALSEDNNCAIITRELIDGFPLLDKKVLVIKTRSIHPENTSHFTNVMVLYDMVERLLTDKSFSGLKLKGYNKSNFTTKRIDNKILVKEIGNIKKTFEEMFREIKPLKNFISTNRIDRKSVDSSLLFRPIGQNVFVDVLKVGIDNSKKSDVYKFFDKDNFNLKNTEWKKIFWDNETKTIVTEKSRQRLAVLLILEKLNIKVKKTEKDIEIQKNFDIDLTHI